MDRQTDVQTDRCSDRQMFRQTDVQTKYKEGCNNRQDGRNIDNLTDRLRYIISCLLLGVFVCVCLCVCVCVWCFCVY